MLRTRYTDIVAAVVGEVTSPSSDTMCNTVFFDEFFFLAFLFLSSPANHSSPGVTSQMLVCQMPVGEREHRLWTRTLNRFTRAGLPECVKIKVIPITDHEDPGDIIATALGAVSTILGKPGYSF